MKFEDVLVVGLVHNFERGIKQDVYRLKKSLNQIEKLNWLLIESDSVDGTVTQLERLSQEIDGFDFISLGTLRDKLPMRTERIAYCRNKYLSEIRLNEKYSQVKFVIMADFDGLNNLISEKAIMSCLEREDWDVCTANQLGPYYDIWALRAHPWSPNDCWQYQSFLKKNGWSKLYATFGAVYARMIVLPIDSEWVEVDSAFGGLGIYKRYVLDDFNYNGLDAHGVEICEHVEFHLNIKRKGYRIFINPRLINAKKTSHTKNFFFPRSLKLKLRLLFIPFFR